MSKFQVAAVGAVLLVGGGLTGPMLTTSVAGAAEPVSAQDTMWAQSNAQTDLAEITIGQIALQRALEPTTKSLATTTMNDHVKALGLLKTVAAESGITLPTAPNATQQSQAAQLKTVPATQFDLTYDSDQVQGHELSISETNTEIAGGTNAAVKTYASQYLVVATMHLQMAETDYAALGGSTTSPGSPSIEAGSGGLAATHSADDAPWLILGGAGIVLLAGAAGVGFRHRIQTR